MATKRYIPYIFVKAAELMFPMLNNKDPRLLKVAEYAQEQYYEQDNRICVLCAAPSELSAYRKFRKFCKSMGLNPGKREVIISDMNLKYTNNYSKKPVIIF